MQEKQGMSLNIDWTAAIGGAAVGYYAKSKVEDVKSETKKAISDTAAAAAVAAAQAVINGQSGQGRKGKKTN